MVLIGRAVPGLPAQVLTAAKDGEMYPAAPSETPRYDKARKIPLGKRAGIDSRVT